MVKGRLFAPQASGSTRCCLDANQVYNNLGFTRFSQANQEVLSWQPCQIGKNGHVEALMFLHSGTELTLTQTESQYMVMLQPSCFSSALD